MELSTTLDPPLSPALGAADVMSGLRASSSDRPDAALARGLAEDDPQSLERIYDRFGGATFAFLLHTLRDRGRAEDVQQQVFLEVWQRRQTYDPARAGLFTWVMTIARSRAIDELRRRSPEPAGGGAELEGVIGAGVDEAEMLVERYRVAALLARLHPEEAAVLRMRFYEDLSQTEIAARTGIALGTVKMRMVSALERLRELMTEEAT